MDGRHGILRLEQPDRLWQVHFGLALWPYDLALRFSYDLPENEHVWPDEWFDDVFEQAALDIRATAAKLLLALRRMDAALDGLRSLTQSGSAPLEDLRAAVEQAPLAIDLCAGYLMRLLDDIAAIIPSCYGQAGKPLADARRSLASLLASPHLPKLDAALAALVTPDEGLPASVARLLSAGFVSHTPDLYVVAQSQSYASALPRAARRRLRANAEVILDAAAQLDQSLRETCGWLDRLLAHLIDQVCARAEEGPDLRRRWDRPDWSVLEQWSSPDAAIERRLPALRL